MKLTVETKGYKVNLGYCLKLRRYLEEIIDFIKDFDIINDSKYTEEIKKLQNDLNSFIDNNFKE